MSRRYGEKHHRAKLTDDDVRLMRALRDEFSISYGQIAEKFECARSTAQHILNNRRRKLCIQQ